MCVVFPTPTVLLPVMHPCSTFTDTSVFSTAVRKLCNRDVACQEPYKCQPPFSHSWEGPGQTGRSPGWKNKAAKHQKVEKYVLGYFPYAEWFESMSQNPQSELSLNFFNLICPALLGRHIKNLVGKESRKMMQLRTLLSIKQRYDFSMWIFYKNFYFLFVLYQKDSKE